MSEKEKKIYIILIYAINGVAAFLSFVFGLCYAIQYIPVYGCMIMFFGMLASVSFCLLLTFLLDLVCEYKQKNKSQNTETNTSEDKE